MKVKLAGAFSITILVAVVGIAASSPSGFLGSKEFGVIVIIVMCGAVALLYLAMKNLEASQRISIWEYPIIPVSYDDLLAHVSAALYADGFSKVPFDMKVDYCIGEMFVKDSLFVYDAVLLIKVSKTVKQMEKRYMSSFTSALLHAHPDARRKSVSGRCILYIDKMDDNILEMMKKGTSPFVFGGPYHIQLIVSVCAHENKLYMTKGHLMISGPFKAGKRHMLKVLSFLSVQENPIYNNF